MSRSVVVIPTYNEADNIGSLVAAIQKAMPELDILVVDDDSPDGTAALAEGLKGVEVLLRRGERGLGSAYVAGFQRALGQGYERVGGMDADFSHDPTRLPGLFGLLGEFDVAVGSRYVPGGGVENWPVHRRLLSRGANRLARLMLGVPTHDLTGAYRAFRRSALEAIDLPSVRAQGYSFLVEVLFRCHQLGLSVGELPIIFRDREAGASKLSKKEILLGALTLFRLRLAGSPVRRPLEGSHRGRGK